MLSVHPQTLGEFNIELDEVMYYLYLPVMMQGQPEVRVPDNLNACLPLIRAACEYLPREYRYAYISARRGYATPDNPLNRPGWHCDGFGTDDLNFVWWDGPGTRVAVQHFDNISGDHVHSLRQFEEQVEEGRIAHPPQHHLWMLTPTIVHATPIIEPPGCMRTYVKISLSDHEYALRGNSHNYLFRYHWCMSSRETVRNDPARAQRDYYA